MYNPIANKRLSEFQTKATHKVPKYLRDPELEEMQEPGLIELLKDLHGKENAKDLLRGIIKGIFSELGYPIGHQPQSIQKHLEAIGEKELVTKAEDGKYSHHWVYLKIDRLLIHK